MPTSTINELALTESRSLRTQYTDRTDVLDKVKALSMLPDNTHVTTEMVAFYYEVTTEAVEKLTERNREELAENGYKVVAGPELADIKSACGISSRARSLALFNCRAVLNVGQLLRDSDVARRVRTYLLDSEAAHHSEDHDLDAIESMIGALREQRRKTRELETRQAATEAKIAAIEGRYDWFTALGYAKLHDHPTEHSYLRRVGMRAGAILRARGEQPVKRQDATFGTVNTYPVGVLAQAFEEVSR